MSNDPVDDLLALQCAALKRLVDTPADAGIDRGRIREALLNALAEAARPLTPSRKLFERVTDIGDWSALRRLFMVHGDGVYRELWNSGQPLALNRLIDGPQVAEVRSLHTIGFDLSHVSGQILRSAYRFGLPDVVAFVHKDLDSRRQAILDLRSPGAALAKTHPIFAPQLARELTAAAADGIWQIDQFLATPTTDIRALSVKLLLGHDLRTIYLTNARRFSPGLEDLIKLTGSAHGRLKLAELEPNLEDVIARPADSTFFGLAAGIDMAWHRD